MSGERNFKVLMRMTWGAVLVAAGLAAGQGAPGLAGAMQVEEPSLSQTQPPVNPERESVSWRGQGKPRALTDEQKTSMRERRERVRAMVEELKEKRKALDEASPERKSELARELHSFVLDKENERDGDAPERMRQMEQERRDRQLEIQQEKMRALQEKLQHKGNGNNGHDQE